MAQGDFRDLYEKMIDEHRMRYFREVVDAIDKLSQKRQFTRILFGGAEESAKTVINLLPERLADMVVGWLPIPMRSDPQAILGGCARLPERSNWCTAKRPSSCGWKAGSARGCTMPFRARGIRFPRRRSRSHDAELCQFHRRVPR
ncbi:MAG: hypothetical protein IPK19_29145 [Chloroflexi bacterium]|nr:hypothetical protein [Chloroflexota bacterium]